MAGATGRALRRCGAERGKEEGHFHPEQKSRIVPPTSTPGRSRQPAPTGEDCTCTSPAPGPPRHPESRPRSPGRGKPVPRFRQRHRVAQPVGAQKVTLLRPQGTRGQGTQAREQGGVARAPRMRAPGSAHRDSAAPRGSALARPYLPLGPQQAEKLPAPAQQRPRHLGGRGLPFALAHSEPQPRGPGPFWKRAEAGTVAAGRSLAAMLEAGEKAPRAARQGRAGSVFWRVK